MSSDQQAFSTQPGPADSTQICGDVTASVMSSDWYNPAQVRCFHGMAYECAAQQPCRNRRRRSRRNPRTFVDKIPVYVQRVIHHSISILDGGKPTLAELCSSISARFDL
nr:hypothetical protein CFP56_12903 [Quercus suber]